MIRVYCDEVIVLEQTKGTLEGERNKVELLCELDVRGSPREFRVTFVGNKAKDAEATLIPGMRFSFRGFAAPDDEGNTKLFGLAFTPIA